MVKKIHTINCKYSGTFSNQLVTLPFLGLLVRRLLFANDLLGGLNPKFIFARAYCLFIYKYNHLCSHHFIFDIEAIGI